MKNITLYSKDDCQQCRATERALNGAKLEYEYLNMSHDPDALAAAKALGYLSASVVVIEEDGVIVDHWSGFRPDFIRKL